MERVLKRFPKVITVVSRSGSPELATDIMGIELGDVFVMLKPPSEWTSAKTKGELIDQMTAALEESVPGIGILVPPTDRDAIQRTDRRRALRRRDQALRRRFLEVLRLKGEDIARVVAQVPGAADVKLEQTAGLPVIRIQADRARSARYPGSPSATCWTPWRRPARARWSARSSKGSAASPSPCASMTTRHERWTLANVSVSPPPPEALIPLAQLATLSLETGPAQISREAVGRRIVVEVNVRNRDVASFVAEAQARLKTGVQLPAGYDIRWVASSRI